MSTDPPAPPNDHATEDSSRVSSKNQADLASRRAAGGTPQRRRKHAAPRPRAHPPGWRIEPSPVRQAGVGDSALLTTRWDSEIADGRDPSDVPGEHPLRLRANEQPRVLLVASSGGHLLELLAASGQYQGFARHWVTFDKPDARNLLANESVTFAHGPTNRHAGNLVRNALLAFRVISRFRPDAVVTTGAGVGVPFLYAARALGKRAIYVESLARVEDLSLSGRLAYPVATQFFVQWPELAVRRRRGVYAGAVL